MVVHKKKSKHGRGFNHDILPSYFAELIFRRKYLKHQAIATIEKEQEKNEIKKEKKKPWKTAESAIRKTERQPLNYLSCCLKKLASN